MGLYGLIVALIMNSAGIADSGIVSSQRSINPFTEVSLHERNTLFFRETWPELLFYFLLAQHERE